MVKQLYELILHYYMTDDSYENYINDFGEFTEEVFCESIMLNHISIDLYKEIIFFEFCSQAQHHKLKRK